MWRVENSIHVIIYWLRRLIAMQTPEQAENMNALLFHEYGAAENLKYESVPKPQVSSPDDIIIKVAAAGLGHGDLIVRQGHLKYLFPMKFPIILGMDYSGTISAKGENVTDFKVGDKVYGQFHSPTPNGTFAEYTKVNWKKDLIIQKPENLSFEEAAGVPTSAMAAYFAVVDHGKLDTSGNKRVLVIGAAGSIGSWSVQFAKSFGAHVTAICSSIDASICKSLGADEIIDYTAADFTQLIAAAPLFDFVVDIVGGDDYWNLIKPKLVDGGVYSTQSGISKFGGDGNPLISMLWTALTSIPRNMFSKVTYKLYTDAPKSYGLKINEMIKDGKVKCFVNHRYPLKDGAAAQKLLETRLAAGRIVLIPEAGTL